MELSYWAVVFGKKPTREHYEWLKRGRQGPGRIDLSDDEVSDFQLTGKNWTAARFVGCRFRHWRLEASDLIEAEIIDCTFERVALFSCHLERARIERCTLARCNLALSDLDGAQITACNLDGARFARVSTSGTQVVGSTFRKAEILDARLDDATFTDCDFSGADFSDPHDVKDLCTSWDTRFINCDLRDTRWAGRLLARVTFERCRFAGATGQARIHGETTVVAPDFSLAGDGSDIRDAAAVVALLGGSGSGTSA